MAHDEEDGNGDGLVLPTDKLTMILLHVGETRKGIRRLESDVKEVKESITTLEGHSVRKEECTQRHIVVANSVNGLSADLKEIREGIRDIKKGGTGTVHPAVGSPQAAAQQVAQQQATQQVVQAALLASPERTVEEVLERKQEKTRRNVNFWLATIGTAAGLLSAGTVGVIKLVKYLDRVDQLVETNAKESAETRQELKDQLKRQLQPKVIYVRVPSPDGGVSPEPVTPKRPRRRVP